MRTAYLFTILIAISAPKAQAAGIFIGNGGQSVACLQSDGSTTYETFDLMEGRILFGYAYPQDTPKLDPIKLALSLAKRMDQAQGSLPGVIDEPSDNLQSKLQYVLDAMDFLPPGVGLQNTGDTNEFISLPKNCSFLQTVNFRNSKLIYVNSDAWNALSPLNKAAMYLHEAVYWYLRETGVEKDSRRARKAVAYVMAGGALVSRIEVPREVGRVQYCRSRNQNPETWDYDTKLFAYRGADGSMVLQFLAIGGHRVISKTTMQGQVAGGVGEMPIDQNANTMRSLTAGVVSPVDVEAVLKLTWGKGRIWLAGELQPNDVVGDSLVCEEKRL